VCNRGGRPSPTCRPDDRRLHRAAGSREPDLGRPAIRGELLKLGCRLGPSTDPPDPQASADTAGTAADHRHVLATVPARAGLDHAGRRLLPRRLRDHAETDLRLLRLGSPQPLRPGLVIVAAVGALLLGSQARLGCFRQTGSVTLLFGQSFKPYCPGATRSVIARTFSAIVGRRSCACRGLSPQLVATTVNPVNVDGSVEWHSRRP
jgi:hypothetical protein